MLIVFYIYVLFIFDIFNLNCHILYLQTSFKCPCISSQTTGTALHIEFSGVLYSNSCSLFFIDVVILIFLNPQYIGIKVEIDTFETADYLSQI